MISRRKLLRATALGSMSAAALKVFGGRALAQNYPARPMRWVVPYPPGGATDIVARIVGAYLSESLGQQVVIENRPGAGNNLGTEAVVNAPPDGHTFLLVNPANAINATLYKKLSFNYLKDTIQVAGIIRVPNVMEVHPGVPAKTVAEFIAYAKANPGKINWATSGNGTSVHLSGELFKMMTGVDLSARAVSRLGAGADRHAGRPGARDVRQHAAVAAAHQGRQAARARRDDGAALAGAARRADGRRDGRRLRGERVLRTGACPRARRRRSSRGSTAMSTPR